MVRSSSLLRLRCFFRVLLALVEEFYGGARRNDGEDQVAHCKRVCRRAVRFGGRHIEVAIAALFHDLFEGHSARQVEAKANAKAAKLRQTLREWLPTIPEVLIRYGRRIGLQNLDLECCEANLIEDVFSLIASISEPRGPGVPWLARKLSYLAKIGQGDRRVAILSFATKLDGLRQAVRVLERDGSLSGWSDAGPGYNIWLMTRCEAAYENKGLCQRAVRVFRHTLLRFATLCHTCHGRQALGYPSPLDLKPAMDWVGASSSCSLG